VLKYKRFSVWLFLECPISFTCSQTSYSYILSEATAMPNSILPQVYGNILKKNPLQPTIERYTTPYTILSPVRANRQRNLGQFEYADDWRRSDLNDGQSVNEGKERFVILSLEVPPSSDNCEISFISQKKLCSTRVQNRMPRLSLSRAISCFWLTQKYYSACFNINRNRISLNKLF